MASGDPSQAGDAVLVVRPDLTDAELNALFGASWPDRRPASFVPVLARSLTWIAARRGGRLVGFVWSGPPQTRRRPRVPSGCTSTTSRIWNPSTSAAGSGTPPRVSYGCKAGPSSFGARGPALVFHRDPALANTGDLPARGSPSISIPPPMIVSCQRDRSSTNDPFLKIPSVRRPTITGAGSQMPRLDLRSGPRWSV